MTPTTPWSPPSDGTLTPEGKRALKERGVLLSGVGYGVLLLALVAYRTWGITDASWTSIGLLGLATTAKVGGLWAVVRGGVAERLSWDPDFIYLPLGASALLLGAILTVVPAAREVVLVAWFVALLFGAGLISLRGVMTLGALLTTVYVVSVILTARQGESLMVPREATLAGLLLAVHGFAGLVFRRLRRTRQEKRRLRETLEREAVTDPLTGLHNRRFLKEKLEAEVERVDRYGGVCTVAMLDLDHFKQYNDAHGHVAGDEVLRKLAQLCQDEARGADIAARYGGEEFTLVFPNTPWQEGVEATERLRERVEATDFEGEEVMPTGELTVSLGVAGYPEHAETADELIQVADRALYRAKEAGRNRVQAPGNWEILAPESSEPIG